MSYRSNNLAYDLSQFETKSSSVNKSNLEVITNKKHINRNERALGFGNAFLFLLIAGMIGAIIYSNALINELGTQVSQATKEYTTLLSENKRLTANLESKISLKNIETYAEEELGLSKMEEYQIQYINMAPEDKIEYVKNEADDNMTDKLLKSISGFISKEK